MQMMSSNNIDDVVEVCARLFFYFICTKQKRAEV